jgi:Fe-S cluster assembly protein SufD
MSAGAERYVADFRTFAGNGAAGAPSWLRELREAGIVRFAELGFPTMKQEEWRFTSVAPIADTPFTRPHASLAPRTALAPPPSAASVDALALGAGPRVVFVDGRYVPGLSAAALPAGGGGGGGGAPRRAPRRQLRGRREPVALVRGLHEPVVPRQVALQAVLQM